MNEKILKQLNNQPEFYPKNLEKQYPQVLEKIMIMWDSKEFDSYLNKYLLDKREHPRQGFPAEIASEILRLSMLHSQLYGSTPTNAWVEPSGIKLD